MIVVLGRASRRPHCSSLAMKGSAGRRARRVQEGFVDVLRHRRSFRGEGPLEGWVWRAVVNAAHRTRAKRLLLAPFPEVEPAEKGHRARLHPSLLAALPKRQRLAVFLRYFARWSRGRACGCCGGSLGGAISNTIDGFSHWLTVTAPQARMSLPPSKERSRKRRRSPATRGRSAELPADFRGRGRRGEQSRSRDDRGATQAVVGNGAFLHVVVPGRRGVCARAVRATTRAGRAQTFRSRSTSVASPRCAPVFTQEGGNGERWRAPLRDNATAFRIQRAEFPARIDGYDASRSM